MNPIRHRFPSWATGLLTALALSSPILAQAQHTHHAPATAPAVAPAPATTNAAAGPTASAELPWAEAEVRRVDTNGRKLSLKHGEIKNLDMPPMTMVFQVSDPAWLATLKPGDKVRVQVQQIQGAYTVTALEPLR